MTTGTRHSTPSMRAVLLSQLRAVGFVLRRPPILAVVFATLATLVVTTISLSTGAIPFHPERRELFGVLGLLLPIAMWMGEERFGTGFLWTLPVDRRWHALARVFAGWVWLMGVVSVFVLSLFALTLLSGGSPLDEDALRVLRTNVIDTVSTPAEPLFWLVPFTAATATYLLASALALGTRHPPAWIAGTAVALSVVVGVGHEASAAWQATAPGRALLGLFDGPFGFDALLTARTGTLKTEAILPGGEVAVVWRALPDPGQWAMATLLWTGAGLVALGLASSRHRESRRA
ncbi:MAG: hypothetical protein ACRD15_14890 [Vicinamibacterales bacterium]